MTDIAALAIRVESLEARTAKSDLDSLTTSGKRTATAMDDIKGAVKRVAVAYLGFAAAKKLIGGVAETTKDFEQSIANLSAITGATGKDLQFLSDKAKEFGATTTLSASQAAQAFQLVASAKPDLLGLNEELAKVTRNAITLSEATGESLPAAAETLGNALNQFGKGAEDADRFINVLAAGSQRGASLVRETAEALKATGTVASSIGVSFESTNAALQTLSQFAIKGSDAGTALRNVLLTLATQTNSQFNPSIVGLQQAFENLREANLSEVEMLDLFDKRSITAAKTLVNNTEKMAKLKDEITGTSTAHEQAATKVDTLEGDLLSLASAWEALNITVGDKFLPAQREATTGTTILIRAFNDMAKSTDESGESFVDWTGVIVAGGQTIYTLGAAMGAVRDIILDMITVAQDVGPALFSPVELGINLWAELGRTIAAVLSGDFGALDGLTDRLGDQFDVFFERVNTGISGALSVDDLIGDSLTSFEQRVAGFADRVGFGVPDEPEEKAGTGTLDDDEAGLGGTGFDVDKDPEVIAARAKADTILEMTRTRLLDEEAVIRDAADKEVARLQELVFLTAEQQAARRDLILGIREDEQAQLAELALAADEEELKRAEEEFKRIEEKEALLSQLRIDTAATEAEAEQLRFEERMARLEENFVDVEGPMLLEFQLLKEALEEKHQQRLAKIVLKGMTATQRLEAASFAARASEAASFFVQTTAGLAQHSRAMFELNKAAKMAEVLLNVPKTASDAYEKGNAIGGPPVGAAFAAVATAAQLAQLAAIKSTSFEGGGGGTTPSLAGSVPTVNGNPVQDLSEADERADERSQGAGPATQVIVTGNFGINEEVIDLIASGLKDATAERDVVIFDASSRQAQEIVQVTSNG